MEMELLRLAELCNCAKTAHRETSGRRELSLAACFKVMLARGFAQRADKASPFYYAIPSLSLFSLCRSSISLARLDPSLES